MSFGGIGSILSSLGGLAVTPALTTYADEGLRKYLSESDTMKDLIGDEGARELFGDVAGGTLGVVLGTGLNAGLGALTGGSAGAKAGALQGLISSGGAALQHDKFKEALGLGADEAANIPVGGSAPAAPKSFAEQIVGKPVSRSGSLADLTGASAPAENTYLSSKIGENTLPDNKPTTSAEASVGKKPSYFELAGQLGMPALALGMGYGSSLDLAAQREEAERLRKYKEAKQAQDLQNLLSSMYGRPYAEGGELKVQANAGVPTTVTFPEWFIDEFAGTGGLGSYATGGYVNPQAFDPDNAYPQSMIHRAQSYPGAAPIRNEVLNMERGGLLEGEGDGMSDHIPANIDGKEEVRVADGEYVVPKNVAARIGEDKLQQMLSKVRAAAHAKKGKQIIENAGKKAFIQTMSGVKA